MGDEEKNLEGTPSQSPARNVVQVYKARRRCEFGMRDGCLRFFFFFFLQKSITFGISLLYLPVSTPNSTGSFRSASYSLREKKRTTSDARSVCKKVLDSHGCDDNC